jgi:hydroxyacylglutathione hydrolase
VEGTTKATVSAEQAREMLAANEASAIDIRGDEEWRSGHVPGARHRSEDELESALERIDRSQTVIVVCEDGERSGRCAAEARGEHEMVSLEGGMGAWRSADMPMQPSYDPEDDATI